MALEDGEPYDLACLDIMMPVMDGYQVLRSIRDLEADHGIPEEEQVKVIMTTALNDEENVKMAFDAGCSVYSGKPINKRKIRSGIKEIRLDIERSLSWQTILILAICSVFIYLKTSELLENLQNIVMEQKMQMALTKIVSMRSFVPCTRIKADLPVL